jgi:hypothetical protein
MRREFYPLLLVAIGAAPLCRAQSPDAVVAQSPVVFLEKAYFSLGTPSGKHVLFEGQPTVHYFIYNGLSSEKWQAAGGWNWALPVSSVFQVRMTRDGVPLQTGGQASSEPVLTPGYHIGVRPQAFYLWRFNNSARLLLAGLTTGFTHYSNGQHGCTYLGSHREESGACVINSTDSLLARRQIANVVDGDFSTSYFSEALDIRFAQQSDRFGKADNFGTMRWSVIGGLELQQDPLNVRPGGTNQEQSEQYGQRGLIARIGSEWRRFGTAPGVIRLQGDYSRRFGGFLPRGFGAEQLELSYIFDNWKSMGLFFRHHWGYDYYNIHFQERSPFWNIGLLWDLGRLDHFNSTNDHGGFHQ